MSFDCAESADRESSQRAEVVPRPHARSASGEGGLLGGLDIEARSHLAVDHVERYDVATVVELHPMGPDVRMILTFDAMHSDEWTARAVMGWNGELDKLGALIAARPVEEHS